MSHISNRGSVILEVILTIAVLGMIMLTAANYARKEIEKAHRQNISDIIATEVSSFLSFVNRYELDVYKADGNTEKRINPLYDIPSPGTPDTRPDYYKNRIKTKMDDDAPNDLSSFINWSKYSGSSERNFFLDSACGGTGANSIPVNRTSGLNFVDQFLSCERKWENSEFDIDRVDLFGDDKNISIKRVDFYLAFNEITEGHSFEFFNYISNLEKAFDKAGYFISGAYLISRNKNGAPEDWKLVKNGVSAVDVMKPDDYNFLSQLSRNRQYGIRLSMKSDGMNLKADGSVNAEKLCWNTDDDIPVVCIASNYDMLSVTTADGNAASISANDLIIYNGEGVNADGSTYKKYSTVPVTDYITLAGETKQPDNYLGNVDAETGFYSFDIRQCPLNPETGLGLNPRIAVALSSFIGEPLDNNKLKADLGTLNSNRTELSKINRVDEVNAVVIQANQSKGKWLISATMALTNETNGAYSLINPKSLSLVVTTWCSTEVQDVTTP
ncbi:hypothetical protein CRQ31_05570 [Salmonella enterica subsp. enterica serovar Worthington]|uniref:Type II secretion system protein n=1 Tax=Salmonella enterica subsp. enterica serovar Ank TaxID=1173578 RepID=A0A5I2X3Z1_SALET|nr:hypothetical protein [Salmonella enterica]ECF3885272.1 hypothetical protein [Salmonella enterica subsp. enterica serovar Ank]EGI5051718.1 hypothetical protein [Salmonella enterica subsp. enterica serovar Worthington]QGR31507.1 hypothetical protein FOC16_00805 [Salmonella enterica]HAE1791672.1 hypothetical protein [Salmonella enterica subsp. enterica serovar Ank]